MTALHPFRAARRTAWHFLFAITVLFAQQGGLLHSLSHALEIVSAQQHEDDSNTAQHAFCAKCHAFAHVADALPEAVAELTWSAPQAAAVQASPVASALGSPFPPYLSRAPPQ